MTIVRFGIAAACIAMSAPLAAAPPPGVADLVDEAVEAGDTDALATVLDLARAAYPDEEAALAALEADARGRIDAVLARRAAAERERLRAASLVEGWSRRGELGGYHATGSSSESGLSAGLKLAREGIDWRHAFRAHADIRRSSDRTTREQVVIGYEPQYDVGERLFTYGLVEGERDRTQGIDKRLSLSGGLGVRLFDREDLRWTIKGGPAWRRTDWFDRETSDALAGLAATTIAWSISDRLALTQDADAYLQSQNATYRSETGLEADLGGNLLARLAFRLDHETNPPLDAPATDTLTRITIVYDFE